MCLLYREYLALKVIYLSDRWRALNYFHWQASNCCCHAHKSLVFCGLFFLSFNFGNCQLFVLVIGLHAQLTCNCSVFVNNNTRGKTSAPVRRTTTATTAIATLIRTYCIWSHNVKHHSNPLISRTKVWLFDTIVSHKNT